MKTLYPKALLFLFIIALLIPQASFAQSPTSFEVSGWIPYWRSKVGVESVVPNLGGFTEINPFNYTVKQDGSLFEASPLTEQEWVTLRTEAKERGIRFIPTVMWANPDAIDENLRDPGKRQAHIRAIAAQVYTYNLDGIDIDYEGKFARTRPYFSLFLKELYEAIGYDRWVMCTIEARTPLDSRYEDPADIPADIEYANDFKEINKYCDRVRFMTYDQGRFDVKLNSTNAHPYAPVADKAWVEKVMKLAAEEIDKSKLVIGVATYGYEYDMFTDPNTTSNKLQYSRLWSFNPGYATEVMGKLGLSPTRSPSGELYVTYPASQSPDPAIPLPNATRVMVWSDAQAIRDKAQLAKDLGLRGIALFKIDGGQDPGLWGVTAAFKSGATTAKKSPDQVLGRTESGGVVAGEGTSTNVPSRDLQFGMRNEDVRSLQKLLNAHGFKVANSGGGSPGNETIYFGPATRAALMKFQQTHKITPSVGYFGSKTRAVFSGLAAR